MKEKNCACEKCSYCNVETDRHGDKTFYCRRFPPAIVNSASISIFPKVYAHWSCGEFKQV